MICPGSIRDLSLTSMIFDTFCCVYYVKLYSHSKFLLPRPWFNTIGRSYFGGMSTQRAAAKADLSHAPIHLPLLDLSGDDKSNGLETIDIFDPR